ncbi:MAG: DNA polymerase III subunit delta [Phycisphaerales bacterium]|nr:MAG: DNA polymerase III subunit delta [Phycisphaerales bacterium]
MSPSSDDFHHVYAVVGSDRFLRNEVIESIVSRIGTGVDSGGPMRVDGDQATLAEVLDEVRTLSLLGGKRVAIIDDADPYITTHRKALERYCANPAEEGCLILACNAMARNTRLYKIIRERGAVIACDPPARRELVSWIARRAEESYGKRMAAPVAQMLREHLGDSLGVLDAELAKLAAYVGERGEITAGDIDALTGHHREEKVFAITDAMAAGDTEGALRHWEQVLATDRAAPGRAIAGLAWAVRRLLQARRDWEAGVPARELVRGMFMEPAALERLFSRLDTRQLEGQQRDLLGADLDIKTGASTVSSAVERFIVKHSGSGAVRATNV